MPDPSSAPLPDQHLIDAQHEVQRKLGRCMLRVQQFERLLKAMLSLMAVEGTVDQVVQNRAKSKDEVAGKSLGDLLQNYFLKDFLVGSDTDRHQPESTSELQAVAAGLPYFKYRYQMEMGSAALEQTKLELIAFRDLRNGLVHHFLDRFDIGNEASCQAAASYLDTGFEKIDMHCMRLQTWAKSMDDACKLQVAFMDSPAFIDLSDNGINPDGTVDWPFSGIVQALREAEAACGLQGWTLLNDAINWLRKNHADQTPSKYRCKTWRQVLKRSGQFETRTETGEAGDQSETWFQSNINSQSPAQPATAHQGR